MSIDAFFSRLNPLFAALLRSPLHWLASSGLLLLTVTGRKTGRRHTFPVGYQRDGDIVTVMVSEARKKQWWRNLREPAPVGMRLRGRDLRAIGELVAPDSEEFRRLADATLRRVPGMSRVFRVDYDRRTGLTDRQVAALASEIAIVRISLAGPPFGRGRLRGGAPPDAPSGRTRDSRSGVAAEGELSGSGEEHPPPRRVRSSGSPPPHRPGEVSHPRR